MKIFWVIIGQRVCESSAPNKIPASHIVYVSITVIIEIIGGNLRSIYPDVVSYIFMFPVYSRINNRHNHIAPAIGYLPCL